MSACYITAKIYRPVYSVHVTYARAHVLKTVAAIKSSANGR